MPTFVDVINLNLMDCKLDEESNTEPDGDVQECETVVGVCPPEVRKLYILAIRHYRAMADAGLEAQKLHLDMQFKKDKSKGPQFESLRIKALTEKTKYDLLMELVWVSLREHFTEPSLWEKPLLGLRKGWQVVYSDHRHDNSLMNLLGGIIGRGE
jgi:hypothetical protein